MILLASILPALAGFILLALAMQRHQRDLLNRKLPPAQTRLLRPAGWAMLLASVMPMMLGWGFWIGLVLWIALLSFAAFLVVAVITVRLRFEFEKSGRSNVSRKRD